MQISADMKHPRHRRRSRRKRRRKHVFRRRELCHHKRAEQRRRRLSTHETHATVERGLLLQLATSWTSWKNCHDEQHVCETSASWMAEHTRLENDVVRTRLYPTADQWRNRNEIFTARRAIYNRIVAAVAEETKWRCACKTAAPDQGGANITEFEILQISRDASVQERMRQHVPNRRMCRRVKAVHCEVARSAQQDYIAARDAALTNYRRLP
ncbi:hypothetical protein PybrP1_009312 [[Pythium] brassicae (nom. inval.)]|nr:hypothetical protein PybrP1_009312 [[Pythium] brassicae (nom. inval.)]